MKHPIAPWRTRDNFSTPRHQQILDVVNPLAMLTASDGIDVRTTPGSTTVIDARPRVVAEERFDAIVGAAVLDTWTDEAHPSWRHTASEAFKARPGSRASAWDPVSDGRVAEGGPNPTDTGAHTDTRNRAWLVTRDGRRFKDAAVVSVERVAHVPNPDYDPAHDPNAPEYAGDPWTEPEFLEEWVATDTPPGVDVFQADELVEYAATTLNLGDDYTTNQVFRFRTDTFTEIVTVDGDDFEVERTGGVAFVFIQGEGEGYYLANDAAGNWFPDLLRARNS